MHRESILMYSMEKGFGELFWITCPSCWNSMRYIVWEDGSQEENCPACEEKEKEIYMP